MHKECVHVFVSHVFSDGLTHSFCKYCGISPLYVKSKKEPNKEIECEHDFKLIQSEAGSGMLCTKCKLTESY